MTIIIETTPWGRCRRYYDDRNELLFSEYDGRPPVETRATHKHSIGQSWSNALRCTQIAAQHEKSSSCVDFAAA